VSISTPTGSHVLKRIAAALQDWRLDADTGRSFAVAFSGGVDSTLLLAAMSRLGHAVRALHIDHGLHPDSAAWSGECRAVADKLGVPFASARLRWAEPVRGNLEARARAARYRALADLMGPGEVLMTAHHADDQLETLMLRMVRGAGVRGMRGIIAFDVFGPGFLARPLLGIARAEIERVALDWGLAWIDDPSNEDVRFDRNFLRGAVLPRLTDHWPSAREAAVRLGRAMSDAEEILDAMARLDAETISDPEKIPCEVLRSLAAARQRNLLRFLIRELDLPEPHAEHLQRLCSHIEAPRPGAAKRVQWPGAEGRFYRDHLYLAPAWREPAPRSGPPVLSVECEWTGIQGRLRLVPGRAGEGLPDSWARTGFEVRFRRGGEGFRPLGERNAQPLKKWLHEARIVPWMRDRIPLIVRDDRIVAVGDLWICDESRGLDQDLPNWRIVWENHPRIM